MTVAVQHDLCCDNTMAEDSCSLDKWPLLQLHSLLLSLSRVSDVTAAQMYYYGNRVSARVGEQQISLRGKLVSEKESLLGSAVEHLKSPEEK